MATPRSRLALSAILIAMAGAHGLATIPSVLSQADLRDAIRLGRTSDPRAYLMHHLSTGERQNPVIVGAVYTPFIRVALTAHVANLEGRPFEIDDIDPELLEPVVHVALRWYCCVDREHGGDMSTWNPHRAPIDYQLADRGTTRISRPGRDRWPGPPLRIEMGPSTIQKFGPPPFDDIVLVAVYPLTEFARPSDFVIFREWPSAIPPAPSQVFIEGRVTPQDLASWR